MHKPITMMLERLDPTNQLAMDQVGSFQTLALHQIFDPPLCKKQIVSEIRSIRIPGFLGRGGAVNKSRQRSCFVGSRFVLMVKERGRPLFHRLTSLNPRIDSFSPNRKAKSPGDVRNTGSDGISLGMKIIPEKKKTRTNAKIPLTQRCICTHF